MASDILHIKDSYYFEVPKALWQPHYKTLEDVPYFLRSLHHEDFHLHGEKYTEARPQDAEHALHEFNTQMAGKVLIPQPFGELQTLYDKKSGFAISKFMLIELLVAGLLIVTFNWMKKKMATEHPTKGRLANLVEVVMYYVRDDIAKKAIGHDADKFVPLLWTVFFFIVLCNLVGIVPWLGTATGTLGTTAALALRYAFHHVFCGVSGIRSQVALDGVRSPHGFALVVVAAQTADLWPRSDRNVRQAHRVVDSVIGEYGGRPHGAAGVVCSGSLRSRKCGGKLCADGDGGDFGATMMTILELMVAILQAYVFTLLSAVFIGMAIHEH